MRKLAPVFILTSIVALTSASAFAMGDMKKNKDTSSTPAATQGSSTSSSMIYLISFQSYIASFNKMRFSKIDARNLNVESGSDSFMRAINFGHRSDL